MNYELEIENLKKRGDFLNRSAFHEISRQKSSTLLIYKTCRMRYNNLVNKPFKLEASCGCVIREISNDIDIEALISEADALMYKQKAQHKLAQKNEA